MQWLKQWSPSSLDRATPRGAIRPRGAGAGARARALEHSGGRGARGANGSKGARTCQRERASGRWRRRWTALRTRPPQGRVSGALGARQSAALEPFRGRRAGSSLEPFPGRGVWGVRGGGRGGEACTRSATNLTASAWSLEPFSHWSHLRHPGSGHRRRSTLPRRACATRGRGAARGGLQGGGCSKR